MIVPTEKAIAAGTETLIRCGSGLSDRTLREQVTAVLMAAIPHLVDTGQPAQCSADVMKRPITETCECGHMIGGLHRVVKVLNHDPITVCDPCLNRDEQPAPITVAPSITTRLDGLLDVVLRMEQRMATRVDAYADSTQEALGMIDQALTSLPSSAAPPIEVDWGPTDYEVWRDALSLTLAGLGTDWAQNDMLHRAEWWVQKLRRGSIDQPDGVGDQIARGIQDAMNKLD
jgi:hypothetical protein